MSSQSKKNKFDSDLPMRMVNSCICVMITYTWEQQELNKEKRQKPKKYLHLGLSLLEAVDELPNLALYIDIPQCTLEG